LILPPTAPLLPCGPLSTEAPTLVFGVICLSTLTAPERPAGSELKLAPTEVFGLIWVLMPTTTLGILPSEFESWPQQRFLRLVERRIPQFAA
jgi:hypothetical protein